MRDLLRTTWLPTSVALVPCLMLARGSEPWPVVLPTLATAFGLVPPAWRWFVMSRGRPTIGRAALAGATAGFLIPAVNLVALALHTSRGHGPPMERLSEFVGTFFFFLLFAGSLLLGGPIGAAAGISLATIQRRWMTPVATRPLASESVSDGAIAGTMVAILATPPLSLVILTFLPADPWPAELHGTLRLSALLAGTGLTIVPLGALIGALGVRRWRRINGQPART